MTPARVVVVWCPDWALTAAGVSPAEPAVIVRDDLVVSCTAAAREEGVRPGQKRRDAQRPAGGRGGSRSPAGHLHGVDPSIATRS